MPGNAIAKGPVYPTEEIAVLFIMIILGYLEKSGQTFFSYCGRQAKKISLERIGDTPIVGINLGIPANPAQIMPQEALDKIERPLVLKMQKVPGIIKCKASDIL